MPRPHSIPWLIILLGAGFTVFTGWSFYRAAVETSAVTDSDYYSHGLRYNQTLLERQAAASLGWSTEVRLHGKFVTVVLRDRDRQGVSGALGTLTLFGTGSLPKQQLVLREIAPGSYRTELPAALSGEQPVEIVFHRDGARLSKRLLLALG